jgi:DNA-binding CsgD family transcriptional regulator
MLLHDVRVRGTRWLQIDRIRDTQEGRVGRTATKTESWQRTVSQRSGGAEGWSEAGEDAHRGARGILRARQEPGILLFSSKPLGRLQSLNEAARMILGRADRGRVLGTVRRSVREVLRAWAPRPPASRPPLSFVFASGNRSYALRGYWLEGAAGVPPVLAVLLERINPRRLGLNRLPREMGLSGREVEVVQALRNGWTDKEIAAALGLSAETIRGHLKSIRGKLGVTTRTGILSRLLD